MKTPAQLIRQIRERKAFTLIEVIIASSVFTVVSMITVTIFVNVARTQRRIYLENAIYEDGRFLMERLAREIRINAVDYEEYYNKKVEGQGNYGAEHGCYASRFYNPGTGGPNKGGLGAYCSDDPSKSPAESPGCIVNKKTLDINTGVNPYTGNTPLPTKQPDEANALCDEKFSSSAPTDCNGVSLYHQTELYLIDPRGREKTLFALKKINALSTPEQALSVVKIRGEDTNGDDIVDKWVDLTVGAQNFYCAEGFDCPGTLSSIESTLAFTDEASVFVGFVPLSPLRTNIQKLDFYLSPLEDPRKAFAESDQAIQQQPHVTIVMTLEPAASEKKAFQGNPPSITLQTTVTSRVYNEVKSYMADGICKTYF